MKLYPFYFRLDCLTGNLGSLAESAQKIPDTLPFLLVVAAELPPSIPIFSGENLGLVHLSLQETPQHCEPLRNGILKRCRRFGTKTAQLQPLSFLTENPETPNPQPGCWPQEPQPSLSNTFVGDAGCLICPCSFWARHSSCAHGSNSQKFPTQRLRTTNNRPLPAAMRALRAPSAWPTTIIRCCYCCRAIAFSAKTAN